MKLSYDPDKRRQTLEKRGLDFDDAPVVFAGLHFDVDDDRRDYGERRCITTGILGDSVVNLVWTPRDGGRRIISMRKAREDERQRYFERLGGP